MTNLDNLVEDLAELEHRQWVYWSQAAAPYVAPEIQARWQASWLPYDSLPDELKELDRVWARQVVKLLRERKPDFEP